MVATQRFFIFTPKMEKIPIFTNIFQMGWFNHQLVFFLTFQKWLYSSLFIIFGPVIFAYIGRGFFLPKWEKSDLRWYWLCLVVRLFFFILDSVEFLDQTSGFSPAKMFFFCQGKIHQLEIYHHFLQLCLVAPKRFGSLFLQWFSR